MQGPTCDIRGFRPELDTRYNNFSKFLQIANRPCPSSLGGNCIDQARNINIKIQNLLLGDDWQAGFIRAKEWPHWVTAIDNGISRFLIDPFLGASSDVDIKNMRSPINDLACWFGRRHVDFLPQGDDVVIKRKEWNEAWTFNAREPLSGVLPTQQELIDGVSLTVKDVLFLSVVARGHVYDVCMNAGKRELRARSDEPTWNKESAPVFDQIMGEISQEIGISRAEIVDYMNEAADIHAQIAKQRQAI